MRGANELGNAIQRAGTPWCVNPGYTVVASLRSGELLIYDALELAQRLPIRGPTWLSGSQIWLSANDQHIADVLDHEAVANLPPTDTLLATSVREAAPFRLVASQSVPGEFTSSVWAGIQRMRPDASAADEGRGSLVITLGILYGDLIDGTPQKGQVIPVLLQGSGVAIGPLLDVERGAACVTCLTMREAAAISEILDLDEPVRPGSLATGAVQPDEGLTELVASTVCTFVSQVANARRMPSHRLLTQIVRIDYLAWRVRHANAFPLLHCPACGVGGDVDWGHQA